MQVKEELLGSKTIITGRVFPGCERIEDEKMRRLEDEKNLSTSQPLNLSTSGVEGVRIYLEDGTYTVTDKKGMYHFEGVKPGTHVVQLDLETIPDDYELVSCEENDRFAGAPYSQFVDLQGGAIWRADFYAARKPEAPPVEIKGLVGIELSSVLALTPALSQGERVNGGVDYEVSLLVGDVPVTNLRLSVVLPEGVEYSKESSRLEDAALPDPETMENVLTYRLGDAKEGWKGRIRFTAYAALDGKNDDLIAKAVLTFDSPGTKNRRTPLVDNILKRDIKEERKANPDITLRPNFEEFGTELCADDQLMLDQIIEDLKKMSVTHIFVTGHTNSTRISPRSRHIHADNYALSLARAGSVGSYIAGGLGLSPSQITLEGKGPDEPIASNKTKKGRAQNRRVELRIVSETAIQWSELQNIKDRSGVRDVEISGVKAVEKSAAEKEREERIKVRTMPEFDSAWLDKAEPGLAFVWPYDGFHPPIPSVKIAVKHDPEKKLRLLLNGEEVDPIYLDGATKKSDNGIAVSLWIGISVQEGDNLFEAVEYGESGSEENRIGRAIHYSSPPVKVELVPGKSRLTADGKTPSVIAVRLTDKDGHPAREGVVGEYKVDPPYLPFQKIEDLQNDPLSISKSEGLKYVAGEDGIALIELQATSQTGEATLRFNLVSGENEVRAWLTPGERDWILVGLAEGTAGYNTVSGNMESLGASGADDKYYDDGRIAFFAKGMIKGKWLLTMAYDSEKKGAKKNDSLHGIIDPDKYYTLYGDATQQGYEAASARSLYLKIERDKFYALFGDFETGLNVTELSRYSRNLNGLKSEMKGEKYDFNVFVSDTNQAFVKDEIRGDGTSGLYALSRKNIVINSESIVIETRDRFQSEVIISSQSLTRHLDFDIDYDAGTIYFKSPVYSRDENFNPVYIVINYESFDPSDMSYNYGGRGAVRFIDNKLEVGATSIHEGRVGGDGDLTGIDAKLKLNDKTDVRAEFVRTNTDFNNVSSNGNAYLAEVSRRSEKLDGKVYVREQESEFGLGQQNGSESGTRKLGFNGTYRLNEKVRLKSDAYRQYNLSVDAVRDMAEAQIQYSEKTYELRAGLRHAEDTLGDGDVNSSDQITTGGSFRLMDDRLTVSLQHDQSLMRKNGNGDFPTRTTLGADYKLNDTAILFVAEEFTQGEAADSETTRIGLKASPWSGGQVSSSVLQQYSENGVRLFSVTGLKQTWKVTKKWSIDAGLDRTETLKHPGNSPFNVNVPPASGGTDFTAISLGAGYTEEKWSWTGRFESRTSEYEDKIGVFTGAFGEVKEGLGLAAALQAFRSESSSGTDKTGGDLRFSLAYRPKDTKWIVLDRLDYIFDEQKGAGFNYDNWRIINNMNADYKANRKTQISLQYGAKYVNETIDDTDYSGYTDLTGLEGRYDITKKWDIGLRGSVLHSWDAGQFKYGCGPSVGYNLVKNAWVSAGYNFLGFRDRDFSRADFTAEGPFVKFRMKFDQRSVKDAVKWFSGQ
ncbi:MAG: OmpA family protein [Deltaproteobacteria bacterium]|nr:OmpA family protein [Deltaproteobacteria bacterium]